VTSGAATGTQGELLERVTWDTAIGRLSLLATSSGLCRVALDGEDAGKAERWYRQWFGAVEPRDVTRAAAGPTLHMAMAEIDRYLAGTLHSFDVPLDLRGTPFQIAVWEAVLAIPYGETRTYRDIASAIGRPQAIRAVGAANGANPLSIIVPCHRLVGADGSLRGYGGGLPIKARLLRQEGAVGWRVVDETQR
jgi:O-6-methylguanine DNA methyltransferase